MKQQSRNKAKRWFAWLGGGVIALCLAFAGFWYWSNIPPQIDIPAPVMPNPNGYDYFLRAGAAFVPDTKGVDEITDNSISNKPKKYPLATKEAWLKKNAKSFHLLREGLRYPTLQPPLRSYDDLSSPKYTKYRELAQALVVESHARAERGDWNGAVQSVLDDYHFANQIGRGDPLILVSVAVRGTSLRELANLIPHTDATTAKMAAAHIERIYDQRYPFYKNVQEEKWLHIAGMLELMKNPSQLSNSSSWRMGMIRNFRISISDYPKVFIISKRKLIHAFTKLLDKAIVDAQQPFVNQRPLPAFGNPIVEAIHPPYEMARWNWARSDTSAVLVMTIYALHAYKMNNGYYPKNLEALVPAYLNKIPIDPFHGIAPIQYRLQKEKYLVWSIGPDGVDNHGTPITDKNSNSARYQNWQLDSKGDVVAGINTPYEINRP